MIRRPPRSTRTDTLFPYTTLFRSADKAIGVERIHVEQDAGKLMHDQHPTMSYVDLNRSGVALMEIVSRPDMRSPAEAGAYVRKLRSILRYVGSCDGKMEEDRKSVV